MIVVDMESTGVDPIKHSLLSVGAVEYGSPENFFYEECVVWDGAHVDDEALAINGFKREDIFEGKQTDKELLIKFLAWADTCNEKTIAGQNPATDRDFLKYTAMRYHVDWPFAQRVVDLHSIAYYHMLKRGVSPPLKNNHSALNLEAILDYVGLPSLPEPHNGLTDAKFEAEALSRLISGKPLISSFSGFAIPDFLLSNC